MSFTWSEKQTPKLEKLPWFGWLRVGIRAMGVALCIFGLMPFLLLARLSGFVRLGEAIVQLACIGVLRVIGLSITLTGNLTQTSGAIVANHSSWLDIFVINAATRGYFVAKSEVANWPLIGVVARATGTVFIRRKSTDAAHQAELFKSLLHDGMRLIFFPEGTSTDGLRVLPFKSSLFAPFMAMGKDGLVQPLSVVYHAPKGARADHFGWYGDLGFFEHFAFVLGHRRGHVTLILHDPLNPIDFADRKSLAAACHAACAQGLADHLGESFERS